MMAALAAAAVCAIGAPGARAAEAPVAAPPGLAAAYLKARRAADANDYAAAAGGYRAALALAGGDPGIAERAILASVAAGDMAGAASLARALRAAGGGSRIGALAILTEAARGGDWAAIPGLLDGGPGVGRLVDGLARGWAAVGLADAGGAMAAFDAVIAAPGLRGFGLTHKAYALAAFGDDAGAEAIWSGAAAEAADRAPRLSRRAAGARIAGLSRLGRYEAAALLLERTSGAARRPGARGMRAALAAGRALPPTVADARAGLAESLFTVAAALRGEAKDGHTLLYVRAALALDPAHEEAALLAARLLRGLGRPDEALEAYAAVQGGDAFQDARLGMAAALREAGRGAEAVAVLRSLAGSHGDLPHVHAALGHALDAEGRSAEAVAAYDASLAARSPAQVAPWRILFARARARERVGDWDGARADLRRALEIQPDAPGPLTFLGHAMAVRGERPDEALAMLEAAAEARPESGFVRRPPGLGVVADGPARAGGATARAGGAPGAARSGRDRPSRRRLLGLGPRPRGAPAMEPGARLRSRRGALREHRPQAAPGTRRRARRGGGAPARAGRPPRPGRGACLRRVSRTPRSLRPRST